MTYRRGIFVVVACTLLCVLGAMMPFAPLLVCAVVVEAALFTVPIFMVWCGDEVEAVAAPSFPFLVSAGGRAPPLS
ncbi:MAG: hypothetical protein ABI972_00730 [Acidobacteriota bacterium]